MRKKDKAFSNRAPHWKHDLPGIYDVSAPPSSAKLLQAPPNHVDDVFLELPRSSLRIRGIGVIVGVLGVGSITYGFLCFLYITIKFEMAVDSLTVIGLCFFFFMYWAIIPFMRLDIQLPRNEPIRFNRLRRKVYFYNFKYDRIRIFSRHTWGVCATTHDWEDLIAEACSVYLPGHGGLIENVYIAIRSPGTDNVIARYFFAHDIEKGEKYWALARLYMQQGPQSLPDFVHPPHDWSNEFEISPVRRLAPKVQWPIEMDLESRSAPSVGENQ
jgi:hypothetical protein